MNPTKTTTSILRMIAEELSTLNASDFCEGVEAEGRFVVRMGDGGQATHIDMVCDGPLCPTPATFAGVLTITTTTNADGEPWWQWETNIQGRPGMGPWMAEACRLMADKVIRDLKLSTRWTAPAMTQAAPVVNLTPHPVHILDADGNTLLTIPVSGLPIPRAQKTTQHVAVLNVEGVDVPLVRTVFGAVENLPDPVKGTRYLVSLIVREACPDRDDLLIVEDVVREGSTIKGCRAFGIK